jgi:hypothetical protein
MMFFVGRFIAAGVLLASFGLGVSALEITGQTGTRVCASNYAYIPPRTDCIQLSTNFIFYSMCSFDLAQLTVTNCSADARLAIDGGEPRAVSPGDTFVATYQIEVTSGWVEWKLIVSATGGPTLRYDREYSANVSHEAIFPLGNPDRIETLFQWDPYSSWVVIRISTYGFVAWHEGREWTALPAGDHVLSVSAADWSVAEMFWYTFLLDELKVLIRGNYDGGAKATMWKWTK